MSFRGIEENLFNGYHKHCEYGCPPSIDHKFRPDSNQLCPNTILNNGETRSKQSRNDRDRWQKTDDSNFWCIPFGRLPATSTCLWRKDKTMPSQLYLSLDMELYLFSQSLVEWRNNEGVCDWIWQNPASTHRTTLGDMAMSSINCIIAPWWIKLKKWKLLQLLVYSLAIIVWVNNFQIPEIQAVLSSFFRDGNDIAGGSSRGGGEEGGLNIGVQIGMGRQLKARGPVWGPIGPFLCSQHSKLKITDIGLPFVACPTLQAPIQESHDHPIAPKCHSRLTQGLRKAATETRPVALEQGQQWNVIVYWPFLVKS